MLMPSRTINLLRQLHIKYICPVNITKTIIISELRGFINYEKRKQRTALLFAFIVELI